MSQTVEAINAALPIAEQESLVVRTFFGNQIGIPACKLSP